MCTSREELQREQKVEELVAESSYIKNAFICGRFEELVAGSSYIWMLMWEGLKKAFGDNIADIKELLVNKDSWSQPPFWWFGCVVTYGFEPQEIVTVTKLEKKNKSVTLFRGLSGLALKSLYLPQEYEREMKLSSHKRWLQGDCGACRTFVSIKNSQLTVAHI